MIKAVIFDFGGVILSSPFEAFARYERENGLPDGFLRQLNATNPDTNAWARLERSQVDLAGFAELSEAEAREAGQTIDGAAVLGLLVGELRPEMVEALQRCHERLRTALLTNNFVAAGDGDGVGDPVGDPVGEAVGVGVGVGEGSGAPGTTQNVRAVTSTVIAFRAA
jgi:putative hydrolase of the HAD superfamily